MSSYQFTTESGGVYVVDEKAKTFSKVATGNPNSPVPVFEPANYSWIEVRNDPYDGEFTRIERRPEVGEQVLFESGKIWDWVRTGIVTSIKENMLE